MIDVVIPCRDEARTIGAIVSAFRACPGIGNVIVVDSQCHDETWTVAEGAGAIVYPCYTQGKADAVRRGMEAVQTTRVILCDGDLRGFRKRHAELMALNTAEVILGVPDFTRNVPWAKKDRSWIMTTGERNLPAKLIRNVIASGYTLEVCLNAAIEKSGLAVMAIRLAGVKGTPKPQARRIADLKRDGRWLIAHQAR